MNNISNENYELWISHFDHLGNFNVNIGSRESSSSSPHYDRTNVECSASLATFQTLSLSLFLAVAIIIFRMSDGTRY